MRKVIRKGMLVTALGATLILGACGSDEDTSNNTANNSSENSKETQEDAGQDQSKKEDKGNGKLTKVGEIDENEGGKAKLLGIYNEETQVFDGDFNVKLKDVKLIEMQKIDDEFKMGLEMLTGKEEIEVPFTYLQVSYEVKNNTGTKIMWNELTNIVAGGRQYDALMNDFILSEEEPTDSLFDGAEYTGTVGIMVENPEKIKDIKLVFGTAYDENSSDMGIIHEEKEIDLTMEK
jgi:hypothetical protein